MCYMHDGHGCVGDLNQMQHRLLMRSRPFPLDVVDKVYALDPVDSATMHTAKRDARWHASIFGPEFPTDQALVWVVAWNSCFGQQVAKASLEDEEAASRRGWSSTSQPSGTSRWWTGRRCRIGRATSGSSIPSRCKSTWSGTRAFGRRSSSTFAPRCTRCSRRRSRGLALRRATRGGGVLDPGARGRLVDHLVSRRMDPTQRGARRRNASARIQVSANWFDWRVALTRLDTVEGASSNRRGRRRCRLSESTWLPGSGRTRVS